MSENITLPAIVEAIREELTNITTLRDATLGRSRTLIRSCALSIRAIHRHDCSEADALLAQARDEAKAMVDAIADQPTLYHAGYTQDALKELVEAHLVAAVVRGEPFPTVVLDEMTRVSRSKTTVFKVLLLESCSRTTVGNILLFVFGF